MLDFNIGASALQAAQQALQVVGQNVANANTPGYHLEQVRFQSAQPMVLGGQSYGSGVNVSQVQRVVNQQIEDALTAQNTTSAYTTTLQQTMSQLQSSIPTNTSSISSLLGTVYNDLQQVSSQPNNTTASTVAVSDASLLAQQFNSLADTMTQMVGGLDQSISQAVGSINPILQQIASLNSQITVQTQAGANPNSLLDQRDELVNQVAQQLPVEVEDGSQGQVTLLQSGIPLVIGGKYQQLEVNLDDSSRQTTVDMVGHTEKLTIDTGSLGGLLNARNVQLPNYQNQLNTLANQVATSFDAIQSTGVGVAGGYTRIVGQRGVNDASVPLNSAGLSFPVQAGSLYIGLTNTATGQRTMTQISIDPSTQSLRDIANQIGTALPNVQAFVNSQSGTLSLITSPGYQIDFSGGVDATAATSFTTGTTVTATTGGTYTGTTNDNYHFTFLSSGTVGVTPGLNAQVTDQAGDVLGEVNIGQGYSPGDPITGPNGVTLSLGSGTVTAGDSVSTRVIGQPDTSGILTALGLNSFFSGTDASTMQVNSQLVADPTLLATSHTLSPGDTSNLQRFLSLQNAQVMGNGTQTMTQNFTQMVSNLGAHVSNLNQQVSTNQVLTNQLQSQQQSTSGVSINEEMMNLLQYQQMFQSASQYISTLNTMYEQLFQSL